ncbi:MAG: cytochrome c oxidase assembly protein [Granulosicoccaceae bacterium]
MVASAHKLVAGKMLLLAVGMFGFGYMMVPLYDIICDITGLNGKTGRVSIAEAQSQAVAEDRWITVEFVANVNSSGAWEFRPNQKEIKVKPGELYKATYFAENLLSVDVVGQATPSVSPSAAAPYFNKTECFCFTRQEFEANSIKDMPLTFIIDPKIPRNIDRVTLSYTFFKSPGQS